MSQYQAGDLIRHSAGRAFRLREDPYTHEVERPEQKIAKLLARQVYGSSGYVATVAVDGDRQTGVTEFKAVIAQRRAGDGPRDGIPVKFSIYHEA
jgi:hypothetical protein